MRKLFLRVSDCEVGLPLRYSYGARMGYGRAQWRMLCAFKVAQTGSFPTVCLPPRRATQNGGNPQI